MDQWIIDVDENMILLFGFNLSSNPETAEQKQQRDPFPTSDFLVSFSTSLGIQSQSNCLNRIVSIVYFEIILGINTSNIFQEDISFNLLVVDGIGYDHVFR